VATGLVEARLHDALAVLVGADDPAAWRRLVDEQRALILVGDERPDALADLPLLK
jgi:hypothetical protein